MSRERLKKSVPVVKHEPEKLKDQGSTQTTKTPAIPMTPVQLQRAKAKLERDLVNISQQAQVVGVQNEARAKDADQARVQREADQALEVERKAVLQRAKDARAKQQALISSFKPAVQRQHLEGLQGVKASGIQASNARATYQAAIVPEMVQRLVNAEMSVQAQASRAAQQPNALNTRTDWFNTELPLLRTRHNNPDKPEFDTKNVFEPSDTRAKDLGITYMRQRLSSGLTPKDAASAILSIQSARDRNHALTGLLNYIPSNQSDHSSIQRLVAEGEANFELQRQALFQDDALQARAFQLAKDEANPTKPNSGISERINAKRGAGEALSMNVRLQLEAGLNVSLEAVRVHTDAEADMLAKSVHAIAFTTGKDIFFSSGSYNPNTKSGYELIAHEVTHTVQQASGQVKPGIDTDSSLESAAQSKGAELAAKFEPNAKLDFRADSHPKAPLISSSNAMQRSSLALQREAKNQKLDVTKLNGGQKLFEAIKHAQMVESVKQQLLAAISPESLGLFALVFGAGAIAQATPVGWAADLIIAGLLAFGFWSVGSIIVEVIKDFGSFAKTALEAKSERDLTRAGTFFADAVAKIGVNVVIAMIAHTAAKGVNAKLKASAAQRKAVSAKQIDLKLKAAKSVSNQKPVKAVKSTKPVTTKPKPVKPGGGLENQGYKPAVGERIKTRAQNEAELSQARVKAYEARTRTDAQLAKDVNSKPRTGETKKQANARAKAAQVEIETRARDKVIASLGTKPPENIRMAEFEGIGNAHTLLNHGSEIPMRRADVPVGSGLRTIEGRLFGDKPWDKQIAYSFKWLSDSVMDRTVRTFINDNWDAIRVSLATDKQYVKTFSTSTSVGEGFYNPAPKGTTPTPIYFKTSLITIVVRLNPNAPHGFTIHTVFPAATGGK